MSLEDDIIQQKEEKDLVLVAHNYQVGLIQDTADYVGDSFGLAKQVTEMDVANVVFCGVDFMAESAAVLNRDKTVIHPEPKARCPMAAMVDMDELREYKREHPDTAIVSYVNTNIETKAESDICCTSSNAVKVVESVEEDRVLFLPDKNLGSYVKKFVKDKEVDIWEGFCGTHDNITVDDVEVLLEDHPEAEIIVHPECRPEVVEMADHVGSTAGILRRAKESSAKVMIIGTEKEMGHRLKKEAPDKEFLFPGDPTCQNMKKITPEKVLKSLKTLKPVVDLDEDLMDRAQVPLERMMNVGRGN